jgi:hypothetical protein
MKTPVTVALFFTLVLLTISVMAQQPETPDSDLLRTKIEQVENADLKSKSKLVQDIYKQTLQRLYQEYLTALRQDVADLRQIQKAAQTDLQGKITSEIVKLSNEINLTAEKLKTVEGDTQAAANRPAGSVKEPAEAPATAPTDNGDSVRSSFLRPLVSNDSSGLKITAVPPSMSLNAANAPAAASVQATVTLCGQIKPASLVDILAKVQSNPDLVNRVDAIVGAAAGGGAANQAQAAADAWKATKFSLVPNDCVNADADAPPNLKEGSQKDAIVKQLHVLNAVLDAHPELEGKALPLGARRTIQRQILLLNGYIGNAIVHIKSGDTAFTPITDKDGNYKIDIPTAGTGSFTVSTEADNDTTTRTIEIKGTETSVRLNIPIEDRPVSLLTRAFVGYEQSGAAAAKSEQNFFFDLFISKSFPFRQKIDPDFGERLRTWVDFRFGSVPQSGEATLGEFTAGFATQVSALKVKDVARVFEFMGGLEYRLTGNSGLLPSFDRQTKQKFSLSLIAGAGVTTPTNPLESITTFKVTPGAPGLPEAAADKEFVSFVQLDRDRFFRQYYVGLRMQTFFFNLFNMPIQRFPTQLDIAIGQNEFVTGGHLRGPVVRIDGFVPLPYDRLKFITLFATAMLRPGHATTGIPLVLQPAPDGTPVPASHVLLIALPQPNRDYYRVGFGIDLVSLIQKMGGQKP